MNLFSAHHDDSDFVSIEQREHTETLKRRDQQIGVLRKANESLKGKVLAMKEEEKQRDVELQELRAVVKRLKLQHLDETKYTQWGPEEISAWIINLDPNRLQRYENVLEQNLIEKEVNGKVLAESDSLDGADLRDWGIEDRKDRKYVMGEIEKLRMNYTSKEGADAVPTGCL